MKQNILHFTIGLIFIAPAFSPWCEVRASAGYSPSSTLADVRVQGGVVSLQFEGRAQWIYDIERKTMGPREMIEIVVEPLNEASIKKLERFRSSIVKNITVDQKSIDGKHKINLEIADSEIESLDYLTERPSRLVVDFYAKEAPAATISRNLKAKPPVTKSPVTKKKSPAPLQARSPATTDIVRLAPNGPLEAAPNISESPKAPSTVRAGIYDGADPSYDRFGVKDYEIKEEAIIRSQANYFIPFPMLEFETQIWSQIKSSTPLYQIIPKDNDENKQARLLLKLFEKKRYLVFQKTKKWFQEKYPDSEYLALIEFMNADIEMNLANQEKNPERFGGAIQHYRNAIRKYSKSPLAEKASLFLGIAAFDHGDYLTALRLFQEHLESKDLDFHGSLSKDLARLGKLQVFERMKMVPEALEISLALEQDASDPNIQAEAAFRRGDIHFRNKNYNQAVIDYRQAMNRFPNSITHFPSANYNLAEALFWTEKYKESLQAYNDFIKRFPTNDHSAFAMTRVGELLEIFGVDSSRVNGAFIEAHFRFGDNPKAIVARIRLLSSRMESMKPKEIEPATKTILELAKKLDWPQIETFATIMVADGYSRRGDYNRSIELLTNYYKKNPMDRNLDLFHSRLVENINELMRTEVSQGRFISALQTHQKYQETWLKSSKRLDTDYYLGRAYELGGAFTAAEGKYRSTLNRLYALQGTEKGRETLVLQKLPSDQVINLRLAAVHFELKNFSESYNAIKNIKTPDLMSESEQIERVILLSQLLEKRNDLDSASRFLSELLKTWKGQASLVAKPYLQLAEVEFKQNRRVEAIQSLEKILVLEADSKQVPPEVLSKALQRLADTYILEKNDAKSIEVLSLYLEKFEETQPIASQRYRLGQIYFERGDLQKASDVWRSFKGSGSSFWSNLAQERLKDSKWKDGYRKYINRIPAMVKSNDSSPGGTQ